MLDDGSTRGAHAHHGIRSNRVLIIKPFRPLSLSLYPPLQTSVSSHAITWFGRHSTR